MSFYSYLKQKQIQRWGIDYARHLVSRASEGRDARGTRHLLFSFCDHWEPLFGGTSDEHGDARVEAWATGYPALADGFRDADGVKPQHSFFFPGEHYRPRWLDTLADLSRRGYGEVELHMHHDGDTATSFASDVRRYIGEIASHGHLSRGPQGQIRFAFIHGNWCLANARPDGRYCGVDNEVALLFELGCYADFTFPAPENDSQPRHVNQIMWPTGDLSARRTYETAERARVGERRTDRMLFVQGPTSLFFKRGGMPLRIESSALTAHDPATPTRVKGWGDLGISVEGRPEWVFVKMHTHGAPDAEAKSLLADGGRRLHELLAEHYNDGRRWQLHYVTARETFNIASAAMDGKTGNPGDYRDYVLPKPPVRQ